MDVGARVREVCRTFRGLQEESIVGIEDTSTEELKPFLGQPTFIDSFLIVKFDRELLLPGLQLYMSELLKRVAKHLIPSYLKIDFEFAVRFDILSEVLFNADLPQQALAVKVQYLGHLDHQVLKLVINHCLVDSNELVDELLIHKEEPNQILNSALSVFAEDFGNLLTLFVFHG